MPTDSIEEQPAPPDWRRAAFWIVAIVVGACGTAARVAGVGRSISLDEAWVANSVATPSIRDMFFYDAWLQTSPPLFLLLERVSIAIFGLDGVALRLVPLVFGLVALVLIYLLARRILTPRFALFGWTMAVLSPYAIEYAKTVKQYSLELAAATFALWVCTLYMDKPTGRRFALLVATVTVGVFAAYAIVFVVPGIVLGVVMTRGRHVDGSAAGKLVTRTSVRRGLVLGTASAVTLLTVYVVFALPNSSPTLRSFWFDSERTISQNVVHSSYGLVRLLPIPDQMLRQQSMLGPIVLILVAVGMWLAVQRERRGRVKHLQSQIVLGVPMLLAVVADGAFLYPVSGRTSLFLLPAVSLFGALALQLVAHACVRSGPRTALNRALTVVMIAVPAAVAAGWIVRPVQALTDPVEDMASAMAFLRSHVQDGDLLWVHASSSEGFKLYRAMDPWPPTSVLFGRTGWPCCPRGVDSTDGSGLETQVRDDLNGRLPASFDGRIWLLYTTRAGHWRFVGLDEPKVMDAVFRERGCHQGTAPEFRNIGVSVFECRSRVARHQPGPGPSPPNPPAR